MNIKYKKLLIWDLELLCWENITRKEQLEKTEIIEIGICEVNLETLSIIKSASYLVRPKKLNELSEFCTKLTGINKEDLINADHLQVAVSKIKKDFNSLNCYHGSWGNDFDHLTKECENKQVNLPFSSNFINLQDLYSLMNGLEQRKKMTAVLEELKINSEGQLHSAKWDSVNTAKIILSQFGKIQGKQNE